MAFTKLGSLAVGYWIGNDEGKQVTNKSRPLPVRRHDPASFIRIRDLVGAATDTTWKTGVWLRSWEHMGWHPKDKA